MQFLRSLAPHAIKLKGLADENSPALLTALGVTGTVVTAVLTGRASIKAVKIIEDTQQKMDEAHEQEQKPKRELILREKIVNVWPQYIPPVASGAVTIFCIVMANRISSARIAALVASSAVTERALAEYKDKITEKLGEKKATEIRDEIAQDRVTKNPVENSQVILTGTGDVLCLDDLTGRYFNSSMEKLRGAENNINHQLLHNSHASLSEFYEIVGLPPTTFTDSVGWCMDIPLKVEFSTTIATDGRPCIVVLFDPAPKTGYDYLYE